MVDKEKEITILVTSDLHGYIYPTNYIDNQEQQLGLAKLATLITQKRKQGELLLIDNGDLIQGSPLTYYHAKYKPKTANPIINVANLLGYDAAVIGNHEFNYGQEYLHRAIKQSRFPWLSANIVNQNGYPAFGPAYMLKKIGDIRLAILGLTTHYIPQWEEPKYISGLYFRDALETAKEWVPYIRSKEQPDLLLVAYHGGLERDLDTGQCIEQLTGENQGYQICSEVEGIDILITGHQHRLLAGQLNGVSLLQPGAYGRQLGVVKVRFRQRGSTWDIEQCSPAILPIDETIPAESHILTAGKEIEEETEAWLDRPIGRILGDMTISDPFQARLADNPLIELINKVQLEAAQVEIACTALFSNQAQGFKEKLTMRDIIATYPYPNTLKVIRISGEDIRAALEKSATYFTLDKEGRLTVSQEFLEPKPQHYNYDMWEGIEYTIKVSNPIGQRVTDLTYKGKAVQPHEHYEVVMNQYRAGGGGNYTMFQGKTVIKEIPIDMTELIANYILKRGTIKATCNHNWRVYA